MRSLVQLAAAQSMLIDALQGETFSIRLVTSIRQLQLANISPGQLYVFLLTQDSTGGRTVQWQPQALNASQPNPQPYSITTITFIGQPGNLLLANLAGALGGVNIQVQQKGKKRWRPQP